MRVYKFLSKHFALENLTRQRLKIAEYRDMNDPFELKGALLTDLRLQSQIIQHLRRVGALCFSRNCTDPMLWSHYGDKHTGICLAFDLNVDPSIIQEPNYVKTPQSLDSSALLLAAARIETPEADAKLQATGTLGVDDFREPPPSVAKDPAFSKVTKAAGDILLTKFESWRYEDEVRILVCLREDQRDGSLYFAELDECIQPRMVILGPRCSLTRREIEAAVSGYSKSLTVVQAMLSPTSFEVIEGTRHELDCSAQWTWSPPT